MILTSYPLKFKANQSRDSSTMIVNQSNRLTEIDSTIYINTKELSLATNSDLRTAISLQPLQYRRFNFTPSGCKDINRIIKFEFVAKTRFLL